MKLFKSFTVWFLDSFFMLISFNYLVNVISKTFYQISILLRSVDLTLRNYRFMNHLSMLHFLDIFFLLELIHNSLLIFVHMIKSSQNMIALNNSLRILVVLIDNLFSLNLKFKLLLLLLWDVRAYGYLLNGWVESVDFWLILVSAITCWHRIHLDILYEVYVHKGFSFHFICFYNMT